MESNWRYLVAELGMTNSHWVLAARLLPPFQENILVRTDDFAPWGGEIWIDVPGQLPVFFEFADGFHFPAYFPYPVEPD